jgi:hypothetical protein
MTAIGKKDVGNLTLCVDTNKIFTKVLNKLSFIALRVGGYITLSDSLRTERSELVLLDRTRIPAVSHHHVKINLIQ